jgi:hypothetical protein
MPNSTRALTVNLSPEFVLVVKAAISTCSQNKVNLNSQDALVVGVFL